MYLELCLIGIGSVVIFILFQLNKVSPLFFLSFLLIYKLAATFSSAARNSIYYDLCGEKQLSLWISRRAIVVSSAWLMGFLSLSFFVEKIEFSFLYFGLILLFAAIVFYFIRYKDKHEKFEKTQDKNIFGYILTKLKKFTILCFSNRVLSLLISFSFVKTLFIFWPMSSGALFKFGIEFADTQRLFLYASVLVELVRILTIYVLGRWIKGFTFGHFVLGGFLSGLGILLMGVSQNNVLTIIFLGLMYVGLGVSAMASAYLLRIELPEDLRTQGLGFSVVPYYLADILSGGAFAWLITIYSTDVLLIFAGATLIVFCLIYLPYIFRSGAVRRL